MACKLTYWIKALDTGEWEEFPCIVEGRHSTHRVDGGQFRRASFGAQGARWSREEMERDRVDPMIENPKYSDVRPGDRLIFERPGGVIYGGAVWQSPTTGDILAGDTFLTLRGEWLPEPTGAVKMILDTTYRRPDESWKGQKQ